MMQIEQLFRDYGIDYVTEGHKHSRPGWVNCECPFCTGNPGYHLGYNEDEEYFVCWRCGGHSTEKGIAKLLNLSRDEVRAVIRKYSGKILYNPSKRVKVEIKPFKLPEPLLDDFPINYKKYLEKRNFDPDKIVKEWDLRASGIYSKLDVLDYSHRIIIPIKWDGAIVNFQGRDITGKAKQKYLACPEIREKINIKKTLYGQQEDWSDFGIGVEGVTDVWRFGKYGVGLYGIKYKPYQVRLIKKHFKRFFVMFDPEPQAQSQAKKLVADLRFRGVEAYNIVLPDERDPGDLTDDEAKNFIVQLRTYKIH